MDPRYIEFPPWFPENLVTYARDMVAEKQELEERYYRGMRTIRAMYLGRGSRDSIPRELEGLHELENEIKRKGYGYRVKGDKKLYMTKFHLPLLSLFVSFEKTIREQYEAPEDGYTPDPTLGGRISDNELFMVGHMTIYSRAPFFNIKVQGSDRDNMYDVAYSKTDVDTEKRWMVTYIMNMFQINSASTILYMKETNDKFEKYSKKFLSYYRYHIFPRYDRRPLTKEVELHIYKERKYMKPAAHIHLTHTLFSTPPPAVEPHSYRKYDLGPNPINIIIKFNVFYDTYIPSYIFQCWDARRITQTRKSISLKSEELRQYVVKSNVHVEKTFVPLEELIRKSIMSRN